jgi:hypothetical protein
VANNVLIAIRTFFDAISRVLASAKKLQILLVLDKKLLPRSVILLWVGAKFSYFAYSLPLILLPMKTSIFTIGQKKEAIQIKRFD